MSHFKPKRVNELRNIPIVMPAASGNRISIIITGLTACLMFVILYQISVMTNQVGSAGYERQWHASSAGYLAPFLKKISLNPPVYLAAGDALVADYSAEIAKGGVSLSLAHVYDGGYPSNKTKIGIFLPNSGSGSIRLVALSDGWYRPITTPIGATKAASSCGEHFGTRSFVENWLAHDPACSLHDVAYSVMWRMDRKGS
jgi:hypothetical protein